MTISLQRLSAWRDGALMRIGAVMVSVALLFSLVFQPPKAKAFVGVSEIVSITSLFLATCGLTWGVSEGMSSSGFQNSVGRLLQDYLDMEFAGQTPVEWAGDFAVTATPAGKISLPKGLVGLLGMFAGWVVNKFAITPGGGAVSLPTVTGGIIFQEFDTHYLIDNVPIYKVGFSGIETYPSYYFTIDNIGETWTPFSFAPDFYFEVLTDYSGQWHYQDGGVVSVSPDKNSKGLRGVAISSKFVVSGGETVFILNTLASARYGGPWSNSSGVDSKNTALVDAILSLVAGTDTSISLNPANTLDIPNADTMADDSAFEIDSGVTAGTLGEMLDRILDAILQGNLTATGEVVQEASTPGEVVDVDELGLPALGAALVSRFPFSIPWDIAKSIVLLSAPPVAPYWEVDFMAPLANRVGGFAGDTTIVIDMGEYPIVGQVCRWTSTIGFCLMLAIGTKRLIWTA